MNAFYADTALSLVICLFHFAFPQQILKLVVGIRSKEGTNKSSDQAGTHPRLPPLHVVPSLRSPQPLPRPRLPPSPRLPGPYSSRVPGLSSLRKQQKMSGVEYFFQTQVAVFLLNIFGHWILSVYGSNHITAFMVSGFYMSFLFSTYFRIKKHYEVNTHTIEIKRMSFRSPCEQQFVWRPAQRRKSSNQPTISPACLCLYLTQFSYSISSLSINTAFIVDGGSGRGSWSS